jgi:hypothetical protein
MQSRPPSSLYPGMLGLQLQLQARLLTLPLTMSFPWGLGFSDVSTQPVTMPPELGDMVLHETTSCKTGDFTMYGGSRGLALASGPTRPMRE